MKKIKIEYKIEFSPAAVRQIKKFPRHIVNLLISNIEKLKINPRPSGIKKLVDLNNLYRIRVKDYRVIYKIRDDVLLILIVKISHRKDAYKSI